MEVVQIGEHLLGGGRPCVIAAEAGLNHNGDMELAKRVIDAAADAGANAVKFQNYRTEDFISDRSATYKYISRGKTVVESQYEMFKRHELTGAALYELKAHCDRRGVLFHSTPTSESGVFDLLEMGVSVLKNGSDHLTHLQLIRAMGQTGLPTLLSTGMGTLAEIDEAVRTFRETGNDQLVLLHCVSSYPTPSEDVHLRKIPALAEVFGCPVGFSDHTDGIAAAIGAVVFGACWIERHFTIDKSLPGPDHRFSSDPNDLLALIKAVRAVEKSLGNPLIGPASSETTGRQAFRLSCVAARDLPANHCLADSDIVFRRPGTGLPPKARDRLVGRRTSRSVTAGHVFEMGDLA